MVVNCRTIIIVVDVVVLLINPLYYYWSQTEWYRTLVGEFPYLMNCFIGNGASESIDSTQKGVTVVAES